MYNITERKVVVLDPDQVEQETYQNLLTLSGIDITIAEAMGIDMSKELAEIKLLANQLANNTIANDRR